MIQLFFPSSIPLELTVALYLTSLEDKANLLFSMFDTDEDDALSEVELREALTTLLMVELAVTGKKSTPHLTGILSSEELKQVGGLLLLTVILCLFNHSKCLRCGRTCGRRQLATWPIHVKRFWQRLD